jgi:DNA-binding GntR family transcriptional regulator
LEEGSYKSKAQFAYEYILKKIHNRVAKPGEKLLIEEIAKEIGISRIPVREAFRKLESEGILENFPNKSSRVKKISIEDLKDIYAIRKMIEPRAAVMALTNLDGRDLDVLEGNLKKMERSLRENKVQEYIDLNRKFHFYIYEKSDNRWLPKYIETLWFFARWVNVAVYFENRIKNDCIRSHSNILETLRKKDKKKLEKVFTEHLESSKNDVIRYFLDKQFIND